MKKYIVIMTLLMFGFVVRAEVDEEEDVTWSERGSDVTCQILDNPVDPIYLMSVAFVSESELEGLGDTGVTEIEAYWACAYFYDVFGGNVDANLIYNGMFFMNSLNSELPDMATKIALDAGWTWRYQNGFAFQARFAPGIYSDLEEITTGIIFLPFSFAVVRSFNPQLSGIVGADIRPEFGRSFMPRIGIEWEPNPLVRVSAQLPESRVMYFVTDQWTAHGGFRWRSESFRLRDTEVLPANMMSIEDFQMSAGLTYRANDQMQFTAELGMSMNREIEFKNSDDYSYNVEHDNASFIRFGLGGPF